MLLLRTQVTLSSPPTTVLSCCSRRQALVSTPTQLMKMNKTVSMLLENPGLIFLSLFPLPLDAPLFSQKKFSTSASFTGSHFSPNMRSRARAAHLQSFHQRGRYANLQHCIVWYLHMCTRCRFFQLRQKQQLNLACASPATHIRLRNCAETAQQ
jgi:hypothetical protein